MGGQIGQTSTEEVQSLAAKSGRQAAPIQPVETAVIGGTPSQAKMAGSSANLETALKVSAGEQELPTYLRRLQAARPLLEEEQQRIEQARSMGRLNSLEERVQAAALSTINKTPTTSAVLNVNDDELNKVVFKSPADKAKAREYLSIIAGGKDKDDDGNDVYAPLASLLGFDSGKSLDDVKKDIKKYLTDPVTEMGKAAASGTPNQLLVSQINPEDLGFNNWNEVATLLKLPPEMDIGSLTIEQLTDQIYKIQAEEYSRTSALLRIINDPNVGPAEKEAARRQLQQLGATGVLAAESDISNLASQIDDINTVTIAGREYTISELLSDKTITGLVNDYLKNPERAAEIKESARALADWIDNNKQALETIVGKIDPGVQTVAATVENNIKLKTPSTGLSLNDDVMSALFGDKWKTSTVPLQPPAIYTILKTFPNTAIRQDLTNLMNGLSNRPTDLTYLAGLDETQLQAKGLLTREGIQRYSDYINSSYTLANAKTTEGIIGSLFGDGTNLTEIDKLVKQVKALNDSNLIDDITPEQQELLSIFDSNGDGVVDNYSTIAQKAKSLFSGKSLKDLVNGSNDIKSGTDLLSSLKKVIQDAKMPGSLFARYGSILEDGKITDQEIATSDIQNANLSDLQELVDKKVPGANKLTSLIETKTYQETQPEIINTYKIPSDEVLTVLSTEEGINSIYNSINSLNTFFNTPEYGKLPAPKQAAYRRVYNETKARALSQYTKWVNEKASPELERRVAVPGARLDREINNAQAELARGKVDAKRKAQLLTFIANARRQQLELDKLDPIIRQETFDRYKSQFALIFG